jgi:hypothetical protein
MTIKCRTAVGRSDAEGVEELMQLDSQKRRAAWRQPAVTFKK